MSRVERAEEIVKSYVGMKYGKEIALALSLDFGIEFDLDTSKWSIVDESPYSVSIFTEDNQEMFEIQLFADERISSVDFNENLLGELVPVMNCPMCETGELEHRTADNPKALNEDKVTHVYVCNQCPMVAMEWYDSSDTKAFSEALR